MAARYEKSPYARAMLTRFADKAHGRKSVEPLRVSGGSDSEKVEP